MFDISFVFISSPASSDRDCFLIFFYFESVWGEMIRWWRGYSWSRKHRRDLKSNVSGFSKDFLVLKVDIHFREMIGKKVGKGLFESGFGTSLFYGNILTIMWCHRKLFIL